MKFPPLPIGFSSSTYRLLMLLSCHRAVPSATPIAIKPTCRRFRLGPFDRIGDTLLATA
jgi:hypothetical protein